MSRGERKKEGAELEKIFFKNPFTNGTGYGIIILQTRIVINKEATMERTTRYSKKREAILTALRATESHPTAEWLYQQLKPEHPDLSLGTVYRNLTLFREQGLIRSVGVVDGHERFDANTHTHSHFVCDCCHAVIDIPAVSAGAEIDRSVSEAYGVAVEHHDLTFFGTCADCMQNKTQA